MARITKADHRAYVEKWRKAGPELERIHAEELRRRQYSPDDADALLEMGDYYSGPPRFASGMVEMQKWFMKFAEKKGLLPGRVREAAATYGGEAPALHSMGNRALLGSKWAAFFCSVRCPGTLVMKAYDLAQKWRAGNQPVVSGFHSPVEKEVLKILLRSTVPVCVVLARGLPKRPPAEFRRPLGENRLLCLAPFDAKTRRATEETAARRNQVVAGLAGTIFVAYAAPGSKTEAFCREVVRAGKTCLTFDDPGTANLRHMGFRLE